MTIPEISPLFLLSMCGLSVVCVSIFGVVSFFVLRFTTGELFDLVGGVGGLFGGGNDNQPDVPARQPVARRDLRSKAQAYNFESAVQTTAQSAPTPSKYGENTSLRPDRQSRLNANTRSLNLRPPGVQSDNPDALNAPPPPNFNPNSEYLPNTNSNIGGRLGRYNTGRGQGGQRVESSGLTANARDGLGNTTSRRFDDARRSLRNRANNYDEVFGGMLDADGDGDVDY